MPASSPDYCRLPKLAAIEPGYVVLAAVLWGGATALLAQHLAPPEYAWASRTMSELAAQGYRLKWVMQASMMGYGGLLLLAVALKAGRMQGLGIPSPDWLLMAYAVAILLAGVFSTASFDGTPPSSQAEADLHMGLAFAAGVALAGSVAWSYSLETLPSPKRSHLLALLVIAAMAMLYGLAGHGLLPLGKGLAQRGWHLSCVAWILGSYGPWMRPGHHRDRAATARGHR